MSRMRAPCACGHAHALHNRSNPHRCIVVRGRACRCTGYTPAVECRFCAGSDRGICPACEAELKVLLPPRAREAAGLVPQ